MKKPLVYFFVFFILGAAVFCSPVWAGGHIAVIQGRSLPPYEEAIQGIRQSLSQSDPSWNIDVYDLEGHPDDKKGPIVDLIRKSGAKLVLTVGTEAAQAFRDEFDDLSIVMMMVYDPVGEGLADEQHHYGVYLKVSFDQRFSILKKIVPSLNTLSLLRRAGTKTSLVEEAKIAAATNGLQLVVIDLESLDKFSQVLKEASSKSQALVMILDQEVYNNSTAKELLLFSAREKYPVLALASNYVQAGALMSVSSDFRDNGATAAKLASRLLKGETFEEHFVPTEKIRVAWNKRIAGIFGIDAPKAEGVIDDVY